MHHPHLSCITTAATRRGWIIRSLTCGMEKARVSLTTLRIPVAPRHVRGATSPTRSPTAVISFLLLALCLPAHVTRAASVGPLMVWGSNGGGQLGIGTIPISSVPVQAANLMGIRQAAVGTNYTVGLQSGGTVWTWGDNLYGQLGNGSTADSPTPVRVQALSGVVSVAAGSCDGLAVRYDGTVWIWGRILSGEPGNGTSCDSTRCITCFSTVPVRVQGLSEVVAVAAGTDYSLALKSDATGWAWGLNNVGQLGARTSQQCGPPPLSACSNVPLAVSVIAGVTSIAAGYAHSVARTADGSTWAWGWNQYGQLGNGTTTDSIVPNRVRGLTDVATVAQGQPTFHSVAVRANGTVWAWGSFSSGQLGSGANSEVLAPISGLMTGPITAVAAGGNATITHSLALKSDGTVWAWGNNQAGQLGDGTTMSSGTPAPVVGLSAVRSIAAGLHFSLALRWDGTVWAWGSNEHGQLGNGTNLDSSVPKQVTGLEKITAIAAGGYYGLALGSDGTVWSWGGSGYGELGDGTNGSSEVPVQVGHLSGASSIAAGAFHGLAIVRRGATTTVWAWGDNSRGQLGNGTYTASNVPVQVAGLAGVMSLAGGRYHSLALKTDGTVWTWGAGGQGQLGDGGRANRTTPTRVSSLSGIAGITAGFSHNLAVASPAHRLRTLFDRWDGTSPRSRIQGNPGSQNTSHSFLENTKAGAFSGMDARPSIIDLSWQRRVRA